MAVRPEPKRVHTMHNGNKVMMVADKVGTFFHFRVDNVGKDKLPAELRGRFTSETDCLKAIEQMKRNRREKYAHGTKNLQPIKKAEEQGTEEVDAKAAGAQA